MGLRALVLGFFLGLLLAGLNPQLPSILLETVNTILSTIVQYIHGNGGLEKAVAEANRWLGVHTSEEEYHRFYDDMLSTSISQARSMGWLPSAKSSGERALEVLEWIVLRLTYYPDSHVRYPTIDGGVNVTDQVYMLPNETIKNGGGDCEDLALLAYAMLKATQKPGEEVYLIGLQNTTGGHMAVLLVEKTPQGKRYYIVDPAGNYLNGIKLYLLVHTKNDNGQEYKTPLPPLDISPDTKQWLLDDQLARIAYYHYNKKEYYDTPPLEYYTSADKAVGDWLQYWSPGQARIEIHDIGVHKEFANTTSLAQWLETR